MSDLNLPISSLPSLPLGSIAAGDLLPIVDVSASQVKKVTFEALASSVYSLAANNSIGLEKLNQSSTTKIGSTAIAGSAITAAKLAGSSSIAIASAVPTADNFEGRGWLNSTTNEFQIYKSGSYSALAFGSASIADGTVTEAKIASGAITGDKLATNSVATSKIPANAVTYAKIQNLASSDVLLGRQSSGSGIVEEISCTAAGRSLLAAISASTQRDALGLGALAVLGTTTTATTGTASITTDKIAAAGLDSAALATGSVSTVKLIDSSVTTAKIANSAVTVDKLGAGSVATAQLATSAVTYSKIQNLGSTDVLLGRQSVGAGIAEEIPCTAAGRLVIAAATTAAQRSALGLGALSVLGTTTTATTGDASITTEKIAVAGLGAAALASDSVSTVKLADSSVTTAKLAAEAVTDSRIQFGGLSTISFANESVTTGKIASGAITASKFGSNSSITVAASAPTVDNFEGRGWFNSATSELAVFKSTGFSSVLFGASSIANASINEAKLADSSVTSSKLQDSAVIAAKIENGAVTYSKLQLASSSDVILGRRTAGAGAFEEISCLAAGRLLLAASSTSAQRDVLGLGALAVLGATTTATTGNASITTEKITLTGLTSDALASGSVIASKIADSGVTTSKLANQSVSDIKIQAGGLNTDSLADSSVTSSKIAAGAIIASKFGIGSVTSTALAANAVITSAIASNAVTFDKVQSVSATDRLLGRQSAGPGLIEEIACTAVGRTILAAVDAPAQRAALGLGSLALLNQVGTSTITDSSITTAKINVSGLGTDALASQSVTYSKLQSVNTDRLLGRQSIGSGVAEEITCTAAGRLLLASLDATAQRTALGIGALGLLGATTTITTGDGTITTAKVAATGLEAAALATGAVTTAKLADTAVTEAKLASGAVTAAKLGAASVTNAAVATGAITYDRLQAVGGTDRILGRQSVGSGVVEEISCTAAGRSVLAAADAVAQRTVMGLGSLATQNGTFTGTHAGTTSGTNTGDQTINLTGDLTGSGTGTFSTLISSGSITEGKLASLSVSTAKIQAAAVTSAKLADQSTSILSANDPTGSGAFTGQSWVNLNNGKRWTWTGLAWLADLGLQTVSFNESGPFAFSASYPSNTSVELAIGLDTQAANAVWVGPASGTNAQPSFRLLQSADLPTATATATGTSRPGTGLTIGTGGALNHSNAVSVGTYYSVTIDTQGHVTAGSSQLVASDIPSLDATKITTGSFGSSLIGAKTVTSAKLADYSVALIGSALPNNGDFVGQGFLNPLEKSFFMWDSNVWVPLGISAGEIQLAGTYDASINRVATITTEGGAVGLAVGQPLPTASASLKSYYVVVSKNGTGTSPAPTSALAPPDILLCTGSIWTEIDVSSTYAAQTATNIAFTVTSDISAPTVQGAIEEVSTECRNATNIVSGTLAVARGGTGLATYTKGDLIVASGATALSKLAVTATNGLALLADSTQTTGLRWGAVASGTVTNVSGSGSVTVTNQTSTPVISIASASTTVAGLVQLSDSTSTSSNVLAATSAAVKSAYDLAVAALPLAGGTIAGTLTIGPSGSLAFEGSTDDAFELTLATANPLSDVTVTIPAVTGTLITTGDTGTVTSAMIASESIVDADISTTAAIAGSKIQASSTSNSGAVQLTDSTTSTSTTTAATPNSVKTAYDLANAAIPKAGGIVSGSLVIGPTGSFIFEGSTDDAFELTLAATNPLSDVTVTIPAVTGTLITSADTGTVTSAMLVDGTIVNTDISGSAAITGSKVTAATTSAVGVVQLSDSTNSASSSLAATSAAVKGAYDLAAAALLKTGGAISGELLIGATGSLVFEGSTDDVFELTLAVGNPTADVTLTLPAVTGTVITSADSGTVTSSMIANSTIIDADISASAAILGTKIQAGTTTAAGVLQLTDSIASTSATTAATPNAVKSAYDLANAALAKAGGTVSGQLLIGSTGSLAFDGATASGGVTTLGAVDPTGARSILLPDISGTLITTGDTATISNTMLAGSITYGKLVLTNSVTNADISSSTTIAASKLAAASTTAAGVVQLSDSTSTSSSLLAATAAAVKAAYDLANGALARAGGALTGALTLNAQNQLRLADADSSNYIGFQAPTTVATNVVWTMPATDGGTGQALITNGSGVLSWGSTGGGGDVLLASDNAFAGANTFINTTGQTVRNAATQDGILLKGRVGGTGSFTSVLIPATLTASRTITLPDVTGTVITTGDTSSVSNAMLAGSITDAKLGTIATAGKVSGTAITSGNISTAGSIATTATLAIGASSAVANTDLDLTGTYAQSPIAISALAIDCSTGNYFTKTISANSTFTVANIPSSRAYSFTLELTHTSGTVTWFTGVQWPDAVTPVLTAGKTHLFMFVTDDGGTRWRASSLINYTN